MNRGASAFIGSGGHSAEARSIRGPASKSRPPVIATSRPVWRNISTLTSAAQRFSASSVFCLSGTLRPPRRPPSAVITRLLSQSLIRSARESGEKPPNTTEWIAPIRAQASIA